ncbi:MAG: DNA polymerase II [Spirochaetes bacterium]|nr:DNA polymerase II [Spirochaetota bacterium]
MKNEHAGFIIHSYASANQKKIYLLGRLKNQQTFAIIDEHFQPYFFIKTQDQQFLPSNIPHFQIHPSPFTTIKGDHCIQLSFFNQKQRIALADQLKNQGINTYEADMSMTQQYSLTHQLHSAIIIKGTSKKGKHVDHVFINPQVTPINDTVELSILSLDIETTANSNHIRAIGIAGYSFKDQQDRQKVFFLGKDLRHPQIECFSSEKELLSSFAKTILDFDPDIITGWNVIDFDFQIIARRFKALGLPFSIGRSDDPALFLPENKQRKNKIIIPGRQVIDAMWLARSSPDKYDDYSLETVASTLLGEGKLIRSHGEDKLEELETLYRNNPTQYCLYCLKDADLVLNILKKTGLMDLTIQRSVLTGISLDRAWTSIPPFEHLYTEKLHQRNMVAPSIGTDTMPVFGAEGGLIIAPESGLYHQVLVFDFKSLYPTIIRTFNIDPAGFAGTKANLTNKDQQYIEAPNGAFFHRNPGLLPDIIANFFASREEAKRKKDPIASYVYKILMNSFYGVLGSQGCRFASTYLAGAITGFGQQILRWCQNQLIFRKLEVIYGDTDSLFITSRDFENKSLPDLRKEARKIVQQINTELKNYVKNNYQLDSFLELEFEKIYHCLFIPPIRGLDFYQEDEASGRAKGYAGLVIEHQQTSIEWDISRLEIKGMEAVRSDWTELAHQFQTKVLFDLFCGKSSGEIADYMIEIQKEVRSGKWDSHLIYRRSLRKPVTAYTKTHPPHVKAALLLGWTYQRGTVEYIITKDGPQPLKKMTSDYDYQHYIEKQLKPIAQSIASVIDLDIETLFDPEHDQYLF